MTGDGDDDDDDDDDYDEDDLNKRLCDEDSIHCEAGTKHCQLCGYRGGGCRSFCANYGIFHHILIEICRRFGGTFFLTSWLPHNSALHLSRRHSTCVFIGRTVDRQATLLFRHNRVRWDGPRHSTAVSRLPWCAVALRRTAWSEHGMASVNQTRPHCVNQMGKTHSKPLAVRYGRGTACYA